MQPVARPKPCCQNPSTTDWKGYQDGNSLQLISFSSYPVISPRDALLRGLRMPYDHRLGKTPVVTSLASL